MRVCKYRAVGADENARAHTTFDWRPLVLPRHRKLSEEVVVTERRILPLRSAIFMFGFDSDNGRRSTLDNVRIRSTRPINYDRCRGRLRNGCRRLFAAEKSRLTPRKCRCKYENGSYD